MDRVSSWAADAALTGEFARYGDDAARTDDWTGGDGTHSVRLPDGRVLWLFSDTCLGRVHGPPNPAGESSAWRDTSAPLVRESVVRVLDQGLVPDPTGRPSPVRLPRRRTWRGCGGQARRSRRLAVPAGGGEGAAVGSTFSVLRRGGTYLPFTMAAGARGHEGHDHPDVRLGPLSHDVNRTETQGAPASINADVGSYRPRFVTLRLTPSR
ncbi:hypothetical protein ACH4ZX_16705 [Streptomyces sp. NPDC020490]|uniref:hypothetical protein n=1 Tax=Streptomyces sp. NPDC020490 TaxID=3365078 RepID=UPI0037B4553E